MSGSKILYLLLTTAMVVVSVAMLSVNVANAQQSYPTYTLEVTAPWYYYLVTPWPAPWWNPWAPGNLLYPAGTWSPLAAFNPTTNEFLPILAKSWEVIPQNRTIIVYLRHNLYWFNGSVVIPFTAWDVYAQFYISAKAFSGWAPWISPQNADKDIIVLNNYTIEFHLDYWSPTEWIWMLITWIETPWPVWRPIVEKLQTMNASEALAYSKNITEFVAPYWGLAPYYVTSVTSNYITVKLEPEYFDGKPLLASWNDVYPYHTWQYYPELENFITFSSYSQLAGLMIAHKDFYVFGWAAPYSILQTVNKTGLYGFVIMPDISAIGPSLPLYYPWNIPQVRQAIAYVINRTAVILTWGPVGVVYLPYWILAPMPAPNVAPGLYLTFPESIRSIVINYTVNWTYAAQLLESAGLYYKNGQWYLPNGTPLTLTLYTDGRLDWLTMSSEIAAELSKFGIPTKIVQIETATYYTEESSCQLPDSVDFVFAGGNKGGVDTLWIYYTIAQWTAYTLFTGAWCAPGTTVPFAFPNVVDNHITGWYCQPVTTNLPIPNNTIVWCVNSTFGYINLTNWENAITAATPGTDTYYNLIKVFYSWFEFWVPAIQIGEAQIGTAVYPKDAVDPSWALTCMPVSNPKYTMAAYSTEYEFGIGWGGIKDAYSLLSYMGAFAPPGQIPPLAQAIINGSLWTRYPQYAAFIGLPSPDPELQACVASYFHTTYTPVTTSTTTTTTTATTTAVSTVTSTTTVTSTITSTSVSTTTTATTVTVTKPIISTALVIGIVVIVVVVAAVAALIALRRR